MTLLEVEGVTVTRGDGVTLVEDVSFDLDAGRTVSLVGESGSGKTLTALSVIRHLPASLRLAGGRVSFGGRDLTTLSPAELRSVRGDDIGVVFQDPLASFDPSFTVGGQMVETIRAHTPRSRKEAAALALSLLDRVGIPEPERRMRDYPHQLSGGMAQRVMIAMAISCEPRLLIADEPTTALDVTVQAQILELIERLQSEFDTAVVVITHDLGVVAEMADEIAVMYAGRIVEKADTDTIFAAPEHPYTWGLLSSIPRLDSPRGEELVPIAGRPPSLINLPNGCSFHPRCPYVRDAHKRVEPTLEPVPGAPRHQVACLLDPTVRRKLWSDLQQGMRPEAAREDVMEEEVPR
jgi:peptide/nickel transport system ATP-binding protein